MRRRSHLTTLWAKDLAGRVGAASDALVGADGSELPSEAELSELNTKYSALAVSLAISQLPDKGSPQVPQPVAQALVEGFELARQVPLTAAQIDAYETTIRESNAECAVPWMVPWLRFVESYRRGDDVSSREWIGRAWESGRDRAGKHVESIVNAYIEMAAKANDLRAVRRGTEWALYRGLSVRGLDGRVPTREALDGLAKRLRAVRYYV